MAADSDKSSLPQLPEAPETVKWGLATWHYIRANWEALTKPPVVVVILGAFLLGVQFEFTRNIELLKIKDERIEQLKDQVSGLFDRIGETPNKGKPDLMSIVIGKKFFYPEKQPKELWFRIKLINTSGKKAVCKLFLISLYDDNKKKSIMDANDVRATLQLADSNSSMSAVDINDSAVNFDLAFIDDKEIITPGTNSFWQLNLHPDRLGPGSYTFTLGSDGDNCASNPTMFRIDFRGGLDADICEIKN